MSVVRASLVLLVLVLGLIPGLSLGAGDAAPLETPVGVPSASSSPTPLAERILFIGNSHTDRHGGMDWLVGNFVAAADPAQPYRAEHLTSSGVTLAYHWEHAAPERIETGDWDVVVLQEYLPALPPRTVEPFLESAQRLDEVARASGARTVLYMTWPQGLGDWADLDAFVAAHRRAEAALGVRVAPVGVAMARAHAERPDLALVGPDLVHASWHGAYLAAAVLYATIFERSPEGLAYTFGVDEEDAAFLQRIAWETVSAWQAGEPPAP